MRTLLIIFLCVTSAHAEESPLTSVWGANISGTQNIRELEPRTAGNNREFGPLMDSIRRAMQGGRSGRSWEGDAGPGLPVKGEGIEALNGAYDVLTDHGDRPTTVPAGKVSIVFFARQAGPNCYLEKIERDENVITLSYRFHAKRSAAVRAHLALIPLGELKPGKYEVRTVQVPIAHPVGEPSGLIEGKRLKHSVSVPFSFEVR